MGLIDVIFNLNIKTAVGVIVSVCTLAGVGLHLFSANLPAEELFIGMKQTTALWGNILFIPIIVVFAIVLITWVHDTF